MSAGCCHIMRGAITFEILDVFNEDDDCLSIAMICSGVYLSIGIINLIVELASEARWLRLREVASEGECFV